MGLRVFLTNHSRKHATSGADFQGSKLFDPHRICKLHPAAHEIDIAASIVFLNNPPLINKLKIELPRYLTKADEIADDVDAMQWWKTNEADLPHQASAAKLVLLLKPSSAAPEQVFSILTTSSAGNGVTRLHQMFTYATVQQVLS